MRKTIRKLSLFLIALSLLFISGCAKSHSQNSVFTNGEVAGADLTGGGGARSFTPEPIPLPDAGFWVMQAVKAGEKTFIFAQNEGVSNFYFLDSSRAISKVLTLDANSSVVSVSGDEDGNAYIFSVSPDGAYNLTKVNALSEISTEALDFLAENESKFWDVQVVKNGYLVEAATGWNCYDNSGKYVCELGPFLTSFELVRNSDEILLTIGNDNSTTIKTVDSKFGIDVEYEITGNFQSIAPGMRQGHIFAEDAGIIYDVEINNGARVGYSNSYVSGDVRDLIYLSDEEYLGISNGALTLYTAGQDSGEKQFITLATYAHEDYEIADILEAVSAFNSSNANCQIDILNYATGDYGSDIGAGTQRLYTDIIAGNTPDIYDLSVLPYYSLYDKGLLENLYPYFDKSKSVSVSDLTESVVRTLDYKGKLYSFVPSYYLITMFGSEAASGGEWNTQAFLDYAHSCDRTLFGPEVTRTEFVKYLLAFTADEYIDIEGRTCNFDSSTFPAMLEISKGLPELYDNMIVPSDEFGLVFTGQLAFLMNRGSNPVSALQSAAAVYCGTEKHLGFPSNGNGVALSPRINLGMSSASENKEAVWDFFEYFLSDGYQAQYDEQSIPIKTAARDTLLDSWISTRSKVERIVAFADNKPYLVDAPKIGPEYKAAAIAIIDSIDSINYCDNALLELVMREAAPYYAGTISAGEAAKQIQAKAEIYLSEQYD